MSKPSHTEPSTSNLNDSLVFTTLTLNSTTLYSCENLNVIGKYNLDMDTLIPSQMSEINSSRSNIGSMPVQLSNLDLMLYYIKYILPSNDIVTVMTVFSSDLPLYYPIGVLDNILKDFKEYKETNTSNVEFKARFNQIIKFHETNFQRNGIAHNINELNDVRDVMNDNIESILERNERINLLVNKTDKINTLSNNFRNKSIKVKRNLWWQNVKFWVILGAIGIVILFILIKALF